MKAQGTVANKGSPTGSVLSSMMIPHVIGTVLGLACMRRLAGNKATNAGVLECWRLWPLFALNAYGSNASLQSSPRSEAMADSRMA